MATSVLSPQEYTHPSLLQIVLDNDVTAEKAAPFLNADDKLEVLCVTQAVQADGFVIKPADDERGFWRDHRQQPSLEQLTASCGKSTDVRL